MLINKHAPAHPHLKAHAAAVNVLQLLLRLVLQRCALVGHGAALLPREHALRSGGRVLKPAGSVTFALYFNLKL